MNNRTIKLLVVAVVLGVLIVLSSTWDAMLDRLSSRRYSPSQYGPQPQITVPQQQQQQQPVDQRIQIQTQTQQPQSQYPW